MFKYLALHGFEVGRLAVVNSLQIALQCFGLLCIDRVDDQVGSVLRVGFHGVFEADHATVHTVV